jgi:hypothetical protein
MTPMRKRLLAPRTLFALAAVTMTEAAEPETNARRLILLSFSIVYLFDEFEMKAREVYKVEGEIASARCR